MIAAGSGIEKQPLLREKLMAVVRHEFRVDVLVPDPDDPVLGVKLCSVADCDRPVRGRGLCSGHSLRWRQRRCADFETFLADPGPAMAGRTEPSGCTVLGCRFGVSGYGLCSRHRDKWTRAGQPDPETWAATAVPLVLEARPECQLAFCSLWTENDGHVFCKAHTARWRGLGFPPVDEFVAHCDRFAKAFFDFRDLPAQLKLELQYALQCRSDERTTTAPPRAVSWAIRRARDAGVTSLLDLPAEAWREISTRKPAGGNLRGRTEPFLLYAREVVETLRDGAGWETEYGRDVWRLGKLPGLIVSASRPRSRSHLRFDVITQPWLKALGKRWVRLRLTPILAFGSGPVHS